MLALENRGKRGGIYLEKGEVVHAFLGTKEAEAALRDLFSWTEGEFVFSVGIPSPGRTIEAPTPS